MSRNLSNTNAKILNIQKYVHRTQINVASFTSTADNLAV